MQISIVLPLLNERESLVELTDSIVNVMRSYNFSFEIIFIDDGSSDNSWDIIQQISQSNENVKAIKFQKNYEKSSKNLH